MRMRIFVYIKKDRILCAVNRVISGISSKNVTVS
eukprot:UN11675